MRMLSERKKQKMITDSKNIDRSNDSKVDAALREDILS